MPIRISPSFRLASQEPTIIGLIIIGIAIIIVLLLFYRRIKLVTTIWSKLFLLPKHQIVEIQRIASILGIGIDGVLEILAKCMNSSIETSADNIITAESISSKTTTSKYYAKKVIAKYYLQDQ